ncbi:hypothetical protein LguiA_023528 [Lonicera macranthoides]
MLPQVNYFIPPSEKEGMIVAEIREEIKWLGISEERCWPSESTEGSAVELLRQQKLIKISPSSNGNHFIPRNALTTTLLLSSLLLDY